MNTTPHDPEIPAAADKGAALVPLADTSGDEIGTAEEFDGLDNDLVNVGKFNDTAAPPKTGEKDPSIPVAEAFGIDEQNLHRSDESDELEEAVASLD